jgi:hypothetical protein
MLTRPFSFSFALCVRQIVYVKIPPGRGCGFVQYVQRSSAETAISKMQGEDVKGCKVQPHPPLHNYEFSSH